jgi:MFS family permease
MHDMSHEPSPVTAPVKGRGAMLALLLVLNLLTYMDRQVLAGVESLIQKEMLPNDPDALKKMGILPTAFLLSYMVFSPAFGILGDRMSRWLLVGLGTVAGSIATGATGMVSTFLGVLTARVFVGISEAAYAPVAPTILSDLYPVERRGSVLAMFYAAIPVGSALGYTFGGIISDHLTWHWAFILLGPPGILAGVLACFFRDPRAKLPSTTKTNAPKPARWKIYGQLFRIRSYSYCVAGMTAMTFALGGIAYWMPRYIHDVRGVGTLGQVNFYFGAIAASTGLAATLAGGWLGDRLRKRLRGAYFIVSGLGLLLGFPLFLLVLYLPFPLAWVPLAAAVFMLFFNTGPTNTIIANVVPAPIRATAFALSIFIIHALGDALSPFLIGVIADRSSLGTALMIVSAAFVLGGVLWLLGTPHLEGDTVTDQGGSGADK